MNSDRILVAAICGLVLGFLIGALARVLSEPQPLSLLDDVAHYAQ